MDTILQETPAGAVNDASTKTANLRSTDIDRYVGTRIRERRIMLGMSQQQMAEKVGVTYQQAHKYEKGINRISAGRLFEISRILKVQVTFFFDGLGDSNGPVEQTSGERLALELARNFAQITSRKHQEALSQMARALVAEG